MEYNYNTQRSHLVIKEYGRNIQSLIEHLTTVEDREKRNELARYIIELMGQMNPGLKNIEEFRHKLWDHLFIIADFKLDVDSPYPLPNREEIFQKPDRVPYPDHKIKYNHYGKNVESLIEKAKAMEDPEKKQAFLELIGSYMKLVQRNWNNESISDEMLRETVEKMLGGEKLDENADFDILTRTNKRRKRYSNTGSGRSKSGSSRRKR